MTHKTYLLYLGCMVYLRDFLKMDLKKGWLDFETALHDAIIATWPEALLVLCWYHFTNVNCLKYCSLKNT